jgi:hypothetical protein
MLIGYISAALVLLFIGLTVIRVIRSVQIEAIETVSLSHGQRIALACRTYALDHGGNYPPSLGILFPKYLKDRAVLISPFQPHESVGYRYTTGLTVGSPSDTVIVEDKFRTRDGHDRLVVHVDGTAEVLLTP